jgi:hypothetical protein
MTPLDAVIELVATCAIVLPMLWYLDRTLSYLDVKKLLEQVKEAVQETDQE